MKRIALGLILLCAGCAAPDHVVTSWSFDESLTVHDGSRSGNHVSVVTYPLRSTDPELADGQVVSAGLSAGTYVREDLVILRAPGVERIDVWTDGDGFDLVWTSAERGPRAGGVPAHALDVELDGDSMRLRGKPDAKGYARPKLDSLLARDADTLVLLLRADGSVAIPRYLDGRMRSADGEIGPRDDGLVEDACPAETRQFMYEWVKVDQGREIAGFLNPRG